MGEFLVTDNLKNILMNHCLNALIYLVWSILGGKRRFKFAQIPMVTNEKPFLAIYLRYIYI